ncbi:MAG: hypothetical protein LBT62_05690 [Deltaproteobacteria bacterium]|jgi:hypothetical protein|nr:hypothetical protein [Deltaproteobacteria bacterium]
MSQETVNLDKNNPVGASGSGKTIKIVVVLAAIAIIIGIAVYFFASQKGEEQAKATFAILMDKLAGPGNWSAGEQTFKLSGKTLTAKDVSIDFSKHDPDMKEPITIASVEIVNGLDSDGLTKLFGLTDWISQPDNHLADQIKLNDIKFVVNDSDATFETLVSEILLNGLDLVAADKDNSPGALGFVKNSRLEKFAVTNLKTNFNSLAPKDSFTFSIDKVEYTGIRLGQGVDSIDDAFGLIASLAVKEAVTSGLSFDVKGADFSTDFKIGEMRSTNQANFRSDLFSVSNLSVLIDIVDPDIKSVDTTLENFTLNGVDLAPLLARVQQIAQDVDSGAIDSSDLDPMQFNTTYVSDFLMLPYSIDSASMQNLAVVINDSLKISVGKAEATGPIKAGEIPLSQKFTTEKFVIELPTDLKGDSLDKAAEFALQFGQSVFTLNYKFDGTFDPATGTLTYNTVPLLGFEDLAHINFDLVFTGLTPSVVERLKTIKIPDFYDHLAMGEFDELGLSRVRLEIVNQSLADKIYSMIAKKEDISAADLKEQVAALFGMLVSPQFDDYFEDGSTIAANITEFINNPKSIAIEAIPAQALALRSMVAAEPGSELFNLLNISLTVNDLSPIAVIMHQTDDSYSDDYQQEEFDDQDFELEDFGDEDFSEEDFDEEDSSSQYLSEDRFSSELKMIVESAVFEIFSLEEQYYYDTGEYTDDYEELLKITDAALNPELIYSDIKLFVHPQKGPSFSFSVKNKEDSVEFSFDSSLLDSGDAFQQIK